MPESVQNRLGAQGGGWLFAFAVASLLLVPFGGRASEPEPEPAKVGQSLYRVYCANCHGEAGKGDGSTAAYLTVKPTDLTKLSRGNGGEFPGDKLRGVIDGREVVRGHGDREMPLWGLTFQDWNADSGQEEEVRQKIDQLLSYLKTLQKN